MDVNEVNEQVNLVDQAADVLVQLGQEGGGRDDDGEEEQESDKQVLHHHGCHCLLLQRNTEVPMMSIKDPFIRIQEGEASGLSAQSQLMCSG